MPRIEDERYCIDLEESVDVTVHYIPCGRGRVPTGVECSASPNGRCGKTECCHVLKKAMDDVRNGVLK